MNPGLRLRSSPAIPASQSRILPSQPGSRSALSQHLPLHKRPRPMEAADKRPATVSVAQPRSPAARPYSHPIQLTAQRSPHHRPIVSRARTRFKHTRAYPRRARPPPRHQSPLSRDMTLPGHAHSRQLYGQAPPPKPKHRLLGMIQSLRRESLWRAHVTRTRRAAGHVSRPPPTHNHLQWERCGCFCVSCPLLGERSLSRRRRESKKRQGVDRKRGRKEMVLGERRGH